MTPEERAADIEQLLKTAKKYKKNSWKQASEMRDVVWNKGQDAYFCELLWELIRTGRFDISDKSDFFWYLSYSPAHAFDADDWLNLYIRVLKQPEDVLGYHAPPKDWRTRPAGWNEYFMKILVPRLAEPDFASALVKRLNEVPKPYQSGFSYTLARHGLVPHTQLDKSTLPTAAQLFVSPSSWSDDEDGEDLWTGADRVWPTKIWGRAIVDAALACPASVHGRAFTALEPFATPTELFEISTKLLLKHAPGAVERLRDAWASPETLDLLVAEATQRLGSLKPWDNDSWPEAFLVFALLEVAKRLSVELPSSVDAYLLEALATSRPTLLKQNWLPDCYAFIAPRLQAALPKKRLEKLLVKAKAPKTSGNEAHFPLFTLCGDSPRLAKHTFKKVKKLRTVAPGIGDLAQEALRHFGGALVEPIAEALADPKLDVLPRQLFVQHLDALQTPDTIPALVTALGSPFVVDVAQTALARFDAAALLPHLEQPFLAAKRKDERLPMASILATIAYTPEVGELAKKALAKERVSAIQALLEPLAQRFDAGDAGADVVDDQVQSAAMAKLTDTDGAAWEEVMTELGDGVLDVMSTWLARRIREREDYSWFSFEAWSGVLTAFREDPRAWPLALGLLPLFEKRSYPEDYINMLLSLWPEHIGEIGSVLSKHKFTKREKIFRELRNQPPSQDLIDVLAIGLADSAKGVRAKTAESLASFGPEVVLEHAPRLFEHQKAKVRIAAAELLAGVGTGQALEPLRKALSREKTAKVKNALTEAIAELESAAFSVEQFQPANATNNKALDAALGQLEELPLPKGVAMGKLPALRFKTGAKLSKAALRWFVGRLGAESDEVRDENLWAVRARLDDTDCAALCDALLKTVPDSQQGWIVYAQAVIGADRHIAALGEGIDAIARNKYYQWGSHSREALVRNGSNTAVRWLEHWSRRGRSNTMRGRLKDDLLRIAYEAGISLDDLLDRAMGDFGFDANGVQTLSYGPREITLRLGPENELLIEDGSGKRVKSMPKARKSDDAALAKAARARASEIKKNLKRIHAGQVPRLEKACAGGRRWPVEAWTERFLRHPLMHAYTRRLIFDHDDVGRFVVSDEGELLNVEADELELPTSGGVRIAHPIDMDSDEREAWSELLNDMERATPFPLLNRPIYTDTTPPALIEDRAPAEPAVFMRTLKALGYADGPREDGGLMYRNHKQLGAFDVSLKQSGYAPESLSWLETVELESISVQLDEEPVACEDLPPRVLSELCYDAIRLSEPIDP